MRRTVSLCRISFSVSLNSERSETVLLSYGNAHNCHDDSTLQVRNVEADSWGHTGACSDSKLHVASKAPFGPA